MAETKLDIAVLPTYNTLTMGVADASIYENDPPNVSSPTLEVHVPGFGEVFIPFNVNGYLLLDSVAFGISDVQQALPDGVYRLKYTVSPAYDNYVEKTFLRTDKLQEKFDNAFMKLDLMECDGAVKKQSKVELTTIYLYIQGAIASANNCSLQEAMTLYKKADNMIDRFVKSGCGCSGNNYALNYV